MVEKEDIQSQGFTLLELIIALTILTLVTLIVGSGLKIAMNAWDKGEFETEETQRLRILSGMLSYQLKSAYPYTIKTEDGEEVIFTGTRDSLLFVTTVADREMGGLKWVKYTYRDGNLFYNEGILPDKELEKSIEDDGEIIDTEINRVEFEYLDQEGEWKDSWEEEDSLPQAVRVSIGYFHPFRVNIAMGVGEGEGEEERS